LLIKDIDLLVEEVEKIDFAGVKSIIHLAALVHQMKGASEKEYFKINSGLAFNTAKKPGNEGVLSCLI